MTNANCHRVIREIYCEKRSYSGKANRWTALAIAALIALSLLLCGGCASGKAKVGDVSIVINLFSSHSRYGQSQGGEDTAIKGQIEGGGSASATVPMP